MNEFESTVNAEPVGNVEPQQTVDNTNVESVQGEVATPQQENINQPQSQEINSQYAKIRRESEQRAKDQMISEMYGATHGIHTYADYQRALEIQRQQEEAQQRNIDPQLYSEFQQMKQELEMSKREQTFSKQDSELSNDPNLGEFYKENRDTINNLARQYNTDLDTACTLYLRDNISSILNKSKQQAEQNTIKNINQNATTSTGSLNNIGNVPQKDVWSMNSNDFNQMIEKAKRGELHDYK